MSEPAETDGKRDKTIEKTVFVPFHALCDLVECIRTLPNQAIEPRNYKGPEGKTSDLINRPDNFPKGIRKYGTLITSLWQLGQLDVVKSEKIEGKRERSYRLISGIKVIYQKGAVIPGKSHVAPQYGQERGGKPTQKGSSGRGKGIGSEISDLIGQRGQPVAAKLDFSDGQGPFGAKSVTLIWGHLPDNGSPLASRASVKKPSADQQSLSSILSDSDITVTVNSDGTKIDFKHIVPYMEATKEESPTKSGGNPK